MCAFVEVLCAPLRLIAANDDAKSLCHVVHTLSTAAHAPLTVGVAGGGGLFMGLGHRTLVVGGAGPQVLGDSLCGPSLG